MSPSELTPEVLADELKVTIAFLWALARATEKAYRPTEPRLVNGKRRPIDAPLPGFKKLSKRLHRYLQKAFGWSPVACGGIKYRSHFDSLRAHCGRRFVITRDVRNCYTSITTLMLVNELRRQGFRSDVAVLLAQLSTVHGRIGQGCPHAPDALNFFAARYDSRLACFAASIGARVTRVYDDIVISCNTLDGARRAEKFLDELIEKHMRLEVSRRKRAKNGFQTAGQRQIVHNAVVNDRRGPQPTKAYSRIVIEAAQRYQQAARGARPEDLESLAYKRRVVVGHLNHCRQFAIAPVKAVRAALDHGDRFMRQKLMKAGLGLHRNNWWTTSREMVPGRLARLWKAQLVRGFAPVAGESGPPAALRAPISPFKAARLRGLRNRMRTRDQQPKEIDVVADLSRMLETLTR